MKTLLKRSLYSLAVVSALAAAHPLHATEKFGGDLAFLQKHGEVVVLSDKAGNAKVAVSPKLQGRVLTSTASGPNGTSFGWLNRKLIASGKILPHFNPFGGEDRFWLGPEGGQFSVFFAKGSRPLRSIPSHFRSPARAAIAWFVGSPSRYRTIQEPSSTWMSHARSAW